ncbi:hypothetical protein N7499_001099 [Penicillium canescens]|uniref:F-box domain-containing protein n=1 Tax=Penicillium canescens TaxID=5083 RepID=A0AAD6N3Y7_PENCN|nr:uncharacterized protein N7446_003763 [Penicillium canescens]KAJ6008855.1 hypothetical protein N7522_003871 [Penicillium canescens]KAJ6027640.1 hypothetical protein N7460_012457 [Penicillium canescens]KAJ6040918.1 hypothetical protein N7444_009823 [Penicillium canescens]KAJ6066726.1 hypothetical protein N7446_003763 [Penicillium canescens]KAJ6101469.1 hypothetical protein N7499_001099 [Penicillium canescens]
MKVEHLATELLLQIFRSCDSVSDVFNLSASCRRLHRVFKSSNKQQILANVAETQFGPLNDIIQVVTQNDSQPAHQIRHVSMSDALLKQVIQIGLVAQKWETVFPFKKWKADYENRRSLTDQERLRVRRAVYRLWLYHSAFHSRAYDRHSRNIRHVVLERAQLLHNWSTQELAEIEDLRLVMSDVVQNHICPSNGTIQRKFRKRYPESNHQLSFNIHLNYPPPSNTFSSENQSSFGKAPGSSLQQYFHVAHPSNFTDSPAKYRSRFRNDLSHDPGSEGWGDEIPHYYIIQDMMKLDPGQILWLRDHALLKEQVEEYVCSLGDWFRDNGETFGDTLEYVMNERGLDAGELRSAVLDRDMGIVLD